MVTMNSQAFKIELQLNEEQNLPEFELCFSFVCTILHSCWKTKPGTAEKYKKGFEKKLHKNKRNKIQEGEITPPSGF